MKLGKYRLVERLGSGGVAEVWRAKLGGPLFSSRTIAIKRLLPKFSRNPRFVKQLMNEAQLSAQLHHPNIVAVHGHEAIGGESLLIMEYIDGCDLRRLS